MGLLIYSSANPSTTPFSTSGTFTNPLGITFDGTDGGIAVQQLYLRDNGINVPTVTGWTGITISLVDNQGGALLNGADGYTWKLISGNTQPIMGQWNSTVAGNSISMPDISNTNTWLPFWLYTQVAPNTSVQSSTGVSLQITATANS